MLKYYLDNSSKLCKFVSYQQINNVILTLFSNINAGNFLLYYDTTQVLSSTYYDVSRRGRYQFNEVTAHRKDIERQNIYINNK